MNTLIWVRLETTKGTGEIWTFKGQVLETVFTDVVSNNQTSGYFELHNTYWTSLSYDDEGNSLGETLFEYGGEDRLKPFNGSCFLKIEHVVSITPIDGEMDKARFKKPKNPLSVVRPIQG